MPIESGARGLQGARIMFRCTGVAWIGLVMVLACAHVPPPPGSTGPESGNEIAEPVAVMEPLPSALAQAATPPPPSPPPWNCVVLYVNWRVSGYGTMLIGGKLQLRKEELAEVVEKRMPICRRNSPAAGRADLILDVTAELRYPIEVGHRTLMSMGNLTGGLRLRFGEKELGSRTVHEGILKASGLKRRQIQDAAVRQIFLETRTTLEKGLDLLQESGRQERQ